MSLESRDCDFLNSMSPSAMHTIIQFICWTLELAFLKYFFTKEMREFSRGFIYLSNIHQIFIIMCYWSSLQRMHRLIKNTKNIIM